MTEEDTCEAHGHVRWPAAGLESLAGVDLAARLVRMAKFPRFYYPDESTALLTEAARRLAPGARLTEKQLKAEVSRLSRELAAARKALLEERFKDVPRLAEGELVLVPRKLFGKHQMWPAKIAHVHLDYSEGTDASGTPWVNRRVSYAVFLRQQDGSFGGSSQGYSAREVLPAGEGPP